MIPENIREHLRSHILKILENLVKADIFLHTHDLPKSNQDALNNLSRSLTTDKIEVGIVFKGRGNISLSWVVEMTRWTECLPQSWDLEFRSLAFIPKQSRCGSCSSSQHWRGRHRSATRWNWWALGSERDPASVSKSDHRRYPRSPLTLHLYFLLTYANMHTYMHTKDKTEKNLWVLWNDMWLWKRQHMCPSPALQLGNGIFLTLIDQDLIALSWSWTMWQNLRSYNVLLDLCPVYVFGLLN